MVHVYKQGLFAFAADDHEVDAPIASGSYDAARESVELSVDASAMKVLDPKLAPGRRDTVQSNMSGPQVLDVGKYPTITFRSTKLEAGAPGHLSVTGDLTLHGQTHAIVVDVIQADATHFMGQAAVRQSDFGITPIKIAGGTVRVKDDVKVVFDIALLQRSTATGALRLEKLSVFELVRQMLLVGLRVRKIVGVLVAPAVA